MKIEIELCDLDSLRHQLKELKDQNQELKEKLDKLNEDELIEKAVNLSYRLFNNYIGCVFDKLGFDIEKDKNYINIDRHYLFSELGREWYKSERLDMYISASVSEKFKRAFLTIGVKPRENEKKDDIKL